MNRKELVEELELMSHLLSSMAKNASREAQDQDGDEAHLEFYTGKARAFRQAKEMVDKLLREV